MGSLRHQEILLTNGALRYFIKKLKEGPPEPEVYLGGQLGVAYQDVVGVEAAKSRGRDYYYGEHARFVVKFKDPGGAIANFIREHSGCTGWQGWSGHGQHFFECDCGAGLELDPADFEMPSFTPRPAPVEPEPEESSIAKALGRTE